MSPPAPRAPAPPPAPSAGARIGKVVSYDPQRGLGTVVETVEGPAGGSPLPFHCTAIAGGSRRIEAGTPVAFVLAAGLGGLVEARSVTPLRRGAGEGGGGSA